MQDKTYAKMGEQVRRRRISKKLKAEIVLALLAFVVLSWIINLYFY